MHVERQWRRIRDYTAAGNLDAARIACLSLVQSSPDDSTGWEHLADLETRLGHYRASHFATTQAATAMLRRREFSRLSHVTLRLLGYDEWLAVRELIAATDWQSPDILRQAPALAQHLMLAGDDASALALCERTQGRIRPDARIEYIVGLTRRNLGDATAAVDAFERAIAIDADFAPAHWSLAFHRPDGLSRVPRIEASLARQRSDPSAMADLCYALYRENEFAGRTQVAWTWLARGAAAARSRARAAHMDADAIDHLRDAAPRAPVGDGVPVRLIFIVGLPRSGTTVLERILGNHSRVQAAGELNAFHAALCHQTNTFLPNPSTTRSPPQVGRLDEVATLYRHAIERHAGHDRVVVDKNPANFLYAGLIARALPEARVLCLRRAPMDACFSNLRELFEGDAYQYSYALDSLAEHYAWFDRSRAAFEASLPGRFTTVAYDDLVGDARGTAERVLRFCGLDYEDGCERIERNLTPVSTASSSQVREPVHARGIGAWKTYAAFLEPLRTRLDALGVAT